MKQPIDYPKLKAELDAILDELQSSEGDIDTAVAKYERGMQILQELELYLKSAENRVQKIKADFSQTAS